MLKHVTYYIIFWLVFLEGCRATRSNETDVVADMARNQLGEYFESYPNESGEYVLCIQNESQATINGTLRFIVVDVNHKQVVLEKTFRPGYVKWYSDSELELSDQPGIVRENEDLSRYVKIVPLKKINE